MGDEKAAAAYLRTLLHQPGPYRDRWLRHVRRASKGEVNQAAVAQVLAEHLWDAGEVPDTEQDLPRRLKDPVNRALRGERLTMRMLRMFVEAFDLSAHDSSRLLELREGLAGDVVVMRRDAPSSPPAPPRTYETFMLHEFHRIGADRRPVEHRTVQGIRATAELTSYRYMFDTSAAAVQMVRGGRVSPVYKTEIDGLYAVDIHLAEPLQPGQTASFKYRTLFSYDEPPEPAFRRVARRHVTNVEVNVQFDPRCLPQRVTRCIWDADDFAQPLSATPVQLDAEQSVHHFLRVLDGRGVGFAWEWPPQED